MKTRPKKYHNLQGDDWQSPELKPETYRLVKLLDSNDRRYFGWWTGNCWDGYRVDEDVQIIAWRHVL